RPGRGGASARSPTSRLSSRRPSSDAERGGPLTGVPAEPSVQVVTLALEVRVESDRALKLAQTLRLSADLEEDPADVRLRVRVAGVSRAVLRPPAGDGEGLRNFGDLARRDAVARHPSRLRAGLGTRPVLDTVQQDQPSETHEPVVGDPGAERDETVSAVRLKQHREKAGGLGRNR